jgi:hypothetical protein
VERLSLDVFLAVGNAYQETYDRVKAAFQLYNRDTSILSFYQIKTLVQRLTASGIVPIKRDMCVNSCGGFTGPLAELDVCPMPSCSEPRYNRIGGKQVPRKQFVTIPLAPQLQALRRNTENSEKMTYRHRFTESVLAEMQSNNNSQISPMTDYFNGTDYLETVCYRDENGLPVLKQDDICLILSIDGAQLYQNKHSDCTI